MEKTLPDNTVVRWCRTGRQSGGAHGTITGRNGIHRLPIVTPIAQQLLETVFNIEWRKGFEIVRTQLINQDIDDQSRHLPFIPLHTFPLGLGGSQDRHHRDERK